MRMKFSDTVLNRFYLLVSGQLKGFRSYCRFGNEEEVVLVDDVGNQVFREAGNQYFWERNQGKSGE